MDVDIEFLFLKTKTVSFCCVGFQEARRKDTLERAREPNLNLKGYLQNAYIHPVFKGGEDEDEVDGTSGEKWETESALVPTKRHSRKNTPLPSKFSGSSPSLPEDVQKQSEP